MSTTKLPAVERLAYSISEFCFLVGVSRSFFYTLPKVQRPRMIRVGGRSLIPAEATRAWLQRDEIAA
jgi:excisionase family DNA binding protein